MKVDFLKTESLENISSVKKIIKQIISHSSKVLHFPNPEDKKLEVSLILSNVLPVGSNFLKNTFLKCFAFFCLFPMYASPVLHC